MSRDSAARTLRAVALAGVVVASVLAIGPGLAAGAPTFEYDTSGQAPASNATVVANGTYQHEVAVSTNVTSGPVTLVVFYNSSSDIGYQSYDATVDGQDVTMQTNTTTVTVDGREMTRVRFAYRNPSMSGGETLRLTANMSMPDRTTTTTVYTGGAHAPSGTTLPRRETTVTVDRPDLTVSNLSLEPSSPSPGDSVTVTSTVTNAEQIAAGMQDVQLSVDGNQTSVNSTGVSGSSTSTVSFDWSPGSTGQYDLRVEADASGAVKESDESNNALTQTVRVESANDGGGGGGGFSGGGDDDGSSTPDGTPIEDAYPDQPGTTVELDRSETAAAVTFNESVSGTVEVSDATVDDTEAADIRAAASERFDGNVSVVSAVDISPSVDGGTVGEATVELSVPQDSVTAPENVAVVHLTDDGAEMLNTSVTEAADGSLRLSAETDSFSVFAVVDGTTVEEPQQTPSNDTATPDGSQSDTPTVTTETDDPASGGSGPGFGAGLALVVVVLSIGTLCRRQQ